jgi:hypothetical protein
MDSAAGNQEPLFRYLRLVKASPEKIPAKQKPDPL